MTAVWNHPFGPTGPSDEQVSDAIEREFSVTGEWPDGDAAIVRAFLKHAVVDAVPLPPNVAQWIVTETRGRGEDGRYRFTDREMRQMRDAGTLPKAQAWMVYCEGEPGVFPQLRRDFGFCEWHSPMWIPLVYMHSVPAQFQVGAPSSPAITFHKSDGEAGDEAYAQILARLDEKGRMALANHVAHGARATLAVDGAVILTRRDWGELKILRPVSPQTVG
jgi:hypothetical protein